MEDRSYYSIGKAEEIYEGVKLYDPFQYFKDKDTFIETHIGDDGFEYYRTVPRREWDDEIRKLAKEKGFCDGRD